ncbi:MAG: tRNA-specific adenosine deaminase [Microbacterium sp. 71-36]|uniref:nucleoside deaminase n=1 Tax=unclassified Microbacterium TaxID=2609290 RepID=UPI00086AFD55|nr:MULTISPECIES: nucleoside deaminase [unclassified Microbacterium]MBN9212765.1 nucleoside deaminase [Microbacterium sp.]ODT38614.1 MAG: tRNA-specific adenosine deaminase [Microbacterium sp. SCN 71-17]ODU52745.1 MAG: tRNA-specific adenosine deaminase [Microbacterium sp. SCN 70-10]OJV76015.1 MAG: tRNA-specific adenosine deaminase [Microbacterium sp. 71-36]
MTTDTLDPTETAHLRRAIQVSIDARAHGNHPFGAILVTADGRALEAENTVITDRDVTGHAETNLVRLAWKELDATELAASTLYTSCEPCAMCAGAMFWAGIGRMVYALSGRGLIALAESGEDGRELDLPSREVFVRGSQPTAVSGPHLEDEAAEPHRGFWR